MHSGVLLNYWGPKELFTVRGICHKCGENVQCSIGLGSEGVFPEFHTESVLYNDTLHCSWQRKLVQRRVQLSTVAGKESWHSGEFNFNTYGLLGSLHTCCQWRLRLVDTGCVFVLDSPGIEEVVWGER